MHYPTKYQVNIWNAQGVRVVILSFRPDTSLWWKFQSSMECRKDCPIMANCFLGICFIVLLSHKISRCEDYIKRGKLGSSMTTEILADHGHFIRSLLHGIQTAERQMDWQLYAWNNCNIYWHWWRPKAKTAEVMSIETLQQKIFFQEIAFETFILRMPAFHFAQTSMCKC